MNVTLLAINIGNTRTRLGAYVDGQLQPAVSITHGDESSLRNALKTAWDQCGEATGDVEPQVIIGSVHPQRATEVAAMVREVLSVEPLRVEQDIPAPVGRQLDREAIVGEDRLLNAAGAFSVTKQACAIIDAGTAITIDFVDGAGTFHGGAIAPGATMMLHAMHSHTAQLPEVTLAKPQEQIGHNTVEAMRCGVFHGLRGMVRELVEQYAEMAGMYPMVIATGGDAELLFSDYPLVERIVPDLSLIGIAAAAQAILDTDNEE
jgi:type III pantothenate kinase